MAVLLARLLILQYKGNDNPFHDIVEHHFARGVIAALKEEKIVLGYKDGTFRPNSFITRGQAVLLISRWSFLYNQIGNLKEFPMNEILPNDEIYLPLKKLLNLNIVKGYEDGTFGPQQTLTRAQFAVLLNRLAKFVN